MVRVKLIRDRNQKISDIRTTRSLSKLLGKVGIQCCIYDNPTYTFRVQLGYQIDDSVPPKKYGLGLAETKAYVENKYDYKEITQI